MISGMGRPLPDAKCRIRPVDRSGRRVDAPSHARHAVAMMRPRANPRAERRTDVVRAGIGRKRAWNLIGPSPIRVSSKVLQRFDALRHPRRGGAWQSQLEGRWCGVRRPGSHACVSLRAHYEHVTERRRDAPSDQPGEGCNSRLVKAGPFRKLFAQRFPTLVPLRSIEAAIFVEIRFPV